MSQGYPNVDPVITVASDGDVGTIDIQAKGPDGQNATEPQAFAWYQASAADGLTALGTAQDGAVTGVVGTLIQQTAKLNGVLVTTAAGAAQITIADAGAFSAYLVLVNLSTGNLVVSDEIVHEA